MNEQDEALARRHAERERISSENGIADLILTRNSNGALICHHDRQLTVCAICAPIADERRMRAIHGPEGKKSTVPISEVILHGQLDLEGRVWCSECKQWEFPQNVTCNHLSGADVTRANPERYTDKMRERVETREVFISWWKFPEKDPCIQLTVNKDSGTMFGTGYIVLSLDGAEELIKELDKLVEVHRQMPA